MGGGRPRPATRVSGLRAITIPVLISVGIAGGGPSGYLSRIKGRSSPMTSSASMLAKTTQFAVLSTQ